MIIRRSEFKYTEHQLSQQSTSSIVDGNACLEQELFPMRLNLTERSLLAYVGRLNELEILKYRNHFYVLGSSPCASLLSRVNALLLNSFLFWIM